MCIAKGGWKVHQQRKIKMIGFTIENGIIDRMVFLNFQFLEAIYTTLIQD